MEELKIGEYGRTNLGNIFIFAWLEIDGKIVENKVILGDGQKITNNFYYFAKDERIVKHSKNIIDLIEEEDIAVMNCYGFKVKKIIRQDDILELKLGNYELLEIFTKEQFNQMKYIVGDE